MTKAGMLWDVGTAGATAGQQPGNSRATTNW